MRTGGGAGFQVKWRKSLAGKLASPEGAERAAQARRLETA